MPTLGSRIIAALDIGSTKMVCFIGQLRADGHLHIKGIGHQVSQGIKSGVITNIKQVEESIRACVAAAEQMAGLNIDHVYLGISSADLRSHLVKAEMSIAGKEITKRDVITLIEQGYRNYVHDEREILHTIPVDYVIDASKGILDPKGMYGNNFSVILHMIDAGRTPLFNMAHCLARCHLNVHDFFATPYMAALACLSEDEKALGATVIDFGGGSTSIALFKEGRLLHVESIAIGGAHITNDIAVGLSTSLEVAERIKTLYGSVMASAKDAQEVIDITLRGVYGEGEQGQITKTDLTDIIEPRMDEIIELIKARLDESGFSHVCGTVVLTGGGAQLTGLKEYITRHFGKMPRMGLPQSLEGLAESTKGPGFTACAGILHFAAQQLITPNEYDVHRKKKGVSGLFGKITGWVKENF